MERTAQARPLTPGRLWLEPEILQAMEDAIRRLIRAGRELGKSDPEIRVYLRQMIAVDMDMFREDEWAAETFSAKLNRYIDAQLPETAPDA